MMAFARRLRQCRLGYAVEFDGQAEPFLRLADCTVVQTVELSEVMAAFVEQSSLAVFHFGADPTSQWHTPNGDCAVEHEV